jgi:hypothetical protein
MLKYWPTFHFLDEVWPSPTEVYHGDVIKLQQEFSKTCMECLFIRNIYSRYIRRFFYTSRYSYFSAFVR